MLFPQLTPEIVAQVRAADDLPIIAQLRCSRGAAETSTGRNAAVTFTEQCDAEVVIPDNLPEAQRMELAVLAGRLALEGFEGQPQVAQNRNGSWSIFSLLDRAPTIPISSAGNSLKKIMVPPVPDGGEHGIKRSGE